MISKKLLTLLDTRYIAVLDFQPPIWLHLCECCKFVNDRIKN
jgi:hypothetical protein